MKKSGHYYRESAASVLAMLGSHTTGLSAIEAKERQSHKEVFEPDNWHPTRQSVLLPALTVRLTLLLLAAVAALYVDQLELSILLFVLTMVLGLSAGLYERKVHRSHVISRLKIPTSVRVVRDNTLHTVRFDSLVPGDIVFVENGDIVPADVRLVNANHCVVSETIFDNHASKVRKNVRALPAYVARGKQSCMLFFGTQIVSGEAYGVVTALGPYTETARLLTPNTAPDNRQVSAFASNLQRHIDAGTLILLALFALAAWINQLSLETAIMLGSMLVIATSLIDWYLLAALLAARRIHVLGNHAIRTNQLAALETVGTSRTIIASLRSSFFMPGSQLVSWTVGRTTYDLRKPISTKQAEELQLPYTAARLLAKTEHGHALLSFTKRLPSLSFSTFRRIGVLDRQFGDLEGGVWKSKQQTILAASGNMAAVLTHCTDLWDHGHVRPISNVERASLQALAETNPNAIAIAYAANKTATELVFLGYGTPQPALHEPAVKAFTSLKRQHMNMVFVHDESVEQTMQLLKQTGLPVKSFTLVGSDDLLDAAPLLLANAQTQTSLVLCDVPSTIITQNIRAARHNGPIVFIAEDLGDSSNIHAADTVIAPPHTAESDHAGIVSKASTLDILHLIVSEGRRTSQQLAASLFGSIQLLGAALLLLWAAYALLFLFDMTPLITNAGVVFALLIALLPVRIALGWQKPRIQSLSTILKPVLSPLYLVITTFTAGLLACGSGLLYLHLQHLSPKYLAVSSDAFASAMTITVVTFIACSSVGLFLSHLIKTRSTFVGSATSSLGVLVSILLIYGFVYSTFMQDLFGSASFAPRHWLIVVAAVALYTAISIFAHYDHRHTRKNIAVLHHAHKKAERKI